MIPQYEDQVEARSSAAHSDDCRVQADQCIPCSTAKPTGKSVAFKRTAKLRTYYSRQHGATSALYYGKQDYSRFKRDIKALCLLSREFPHVRRSGALLPLSSDSVAAPGDGEATESLRGLEPWLFDSRARNQRQAQRAVLKCQKILASQQEMTRERKHAALAAASARVSSWSTAVAVETARLDGVRACDGEYAMPTGVRSEACANALPFLFKKRAMSDLDNVSQLTKRRKKA